MAFCRYCGSNLDDNAKFCGNCGAHNENISQPPPPQSNNYQQAGSYSDGIFDPADIEKTKVICAVSYINMLFFLPLAAYPDSKFGKFHANQSLILFIASAALSFVAYFAVIMTEFLFFLPETIRELVSSVISLAISLVPLAGLIYGVVNAIQGEAKELPVIGKYRIIK